MVTRTLSWAVLAAIALIVALHPAIAAGLVVHLFRLLRSAGNELSAFLSRFA